MIQYTNNFPTVQRDMIATEGHLRVTVNGSEMFRFKFVIDVTA